MARSALRNRSVYGEGDEENWNREAEVVRNAGGDASSKTTSLVVADKAADISIGIQPPTSDPFDLSEEVSDRLGRKGKNVQRVFHDDDSEEYEEGGAVVQNPTPPRSQSPTIDMKKGKQRRRSSVKGPVSSQSESSFLFLSCKRASNSPLSTTGSVLPSYVLSQVSDLRGQRHLLGPYAESHRSVEPHPFLPQRNRNSSIQHPKELLSKSNPAHARVPDQYQDSLLQLPGMDPRRNRSEGLDRVP